jgi:spore coat polysaccharide biosynthesis protein SpsF (cytidylyltransferase family)
MELHTREPYDFVYASNRKGWPYGCAAELIDRNVLEKIHAKTRESIYLEHTIPYFFCYPGEFTI